VNRLAWLSIGLSSHLTRIIGIRFGDKLPLYWVIEFPRSGGTWVASMIADYLQIPMPKESYLPIACQAVVHGHFPVTRGLSHVVYVIRDGRDAAVSMAFNDYRRYVHGTSFDRAQVARRYPSLTGKPITDETLPEILPAYIEEWVRRPVSTRLSWARHVTGWVQHSSPQPILVRYEDLHRNPVVQLRHIIECLTDEQADGQRLQTSIEKFSFERQTSRRPGEADPLSSKRKGVVGDWRSYFTREAGEIFAKHGNNVLLQLGYEHKPEWYLELGSSNMT
jgi:hypothetical protein